MVFDPSAAQTSGSKLNRELEHAFKSFNPYNLERVEVVNGQKRAFKMIPGSGIYFVMDAEIIYYIGMSSNIRQRTVRSSHSILKQVSRRVDRYLLSFLPESAFNQKFRSSSVESYFIKTFTPLLNPVNNEIRERWANKELDLLYFGVKPADFSGFTMPSKRRGHNINLTDEGWEGLRKLAKQLECGCNVSVLLEMIGRGELVCERMNKDKSSEFLAKQSPQYGPEPLSKPYAVRFLPEISEALDRVDNKQEFIRAAVREKLERDRLLQPTAAAGQPDPEPEPAAVPAKRQRKKK